jgi:hypothetical protein
MPAVEDEWAVNSVGCESRGNRNSVVHAFAEHLNYSEASRRIHVAQPAISQTILDLEEELGSRVIYVFIDLVLSWSSYRIRRLLLEIVCCSCTNSLW